VYSAAISALFTTDDYAKLLPVFNGPLGAEITAAIQDIPTQAIPATVNTVITNALNSMVAAKIAAKVSDSDIDAALAAQVTAAEMPSARFTVAVYSYKGD
jgi:surface antigen